jgi:hypothetical protein
MVWKSLTLPKLSLADIDAHGTRRVKCRGTGKMFKSIFARQPILHVAVVEW